MNSIPRCNDITGILTNTMSTNGHISFTTTLPHSPSDINVMQNQWAVGLHQDFRVCQNIVQYASE